MMFSLVFNDAEDPPKQYTDKCQSYYMDILKCMRNDKTLECINILESDDFQSCENFKRGKKIPVKYDVNNGYLHTERSLCFMGKDFRRYDNFVSGKDTSAETESLVRSALYTNKLPDLCKSKLTTLNYIKFGLGSRFNVKV